MLCCSLESLHITDESVISLMATNYFTQYFAYLSVLIAEGEMFPVPTLKWKMWGKNVRNKLFLSSSCPIKESFSKAFDQQQIKVLELPSMRLNCGLLWT